MKEGELPTQDNVTPERNASPNFSRLHGQHEAHPWISKYATIEPYPYVVPERWITLTHQLRQLLGLERLLDENGEPVQELLP